jgi:hypothetical protein
MSRPHHKSYSRTVFIVEGISTATMVTRAGRRRTESHIRFSTPEAALAWCRQNHVVLVYLPDATSSLN